MTKGSDRKRSEKIVPKPAGKAKGTRTVIASRTKRKREK